MAISFSGLKSWAKRLAPGRPLLLVLAFVLLAVLFAGLGGFRSFGRPASAGASDARPVSKGEFDVSVSDSRKVVGFVENYGREIEHARHELADKDKELSALKSRQAETENALLALKAAIEERAKRSERETSALKETQTTRKDDGETGAKKEQESPPARIQKFTLDGAKKERDPRKKSPALAIPAGSFGEATLLTGVYAPVSGGAFPITLRLDLALVGPNRSRIPIQECFLVGKATGDANSRRVVVQVTKLSYVRSSGETIEVPVNGYVTDEDGVLGIGGRYVWRVQEIAGLAALSGAIGAAGDAAAQSETVTQLNPLGGASTIVTGDTGRFAAFRGASRAAQNLEMMVLDRLHEVVPAIYVANGKKLTVSFLDGVTLEGVPVKEMMNEHATSPYSGLDLDR